MRKTLGVLLIAATAAACRGRSGSVQRTQQQYDVVQEGQAGAATSTIDAPGEVRPPAATQTAADTTTSFTLPGATASSGAMQAPGSVATTLPPAVQQPRPAQPTTVRTATPPPPPPMTSASTEPAPQPAPETRRQPQHARTTTTETTETTATTDEGDTSAPQTTDTTSTDKKTKDNQKSPPPQTDTSAPPPTQTDTIGGH